MHPRFKLLSTTKALTLIEVLVVIAAVAVLVVVIIMPKMPRITERERNAKIQCRNNLRQVGLAMEVWAGDYQDRFPWQVPVTSGGTMELISKGMAYQQFQAMSNELTTPKVLWCPADDQRQPVEDFVTNFGNANVSYFINVDSSLPRTNNAVFAGDRNLKASDAAVKPGVFLFVANTKLSWAGGIHTRKERYPCGNILFGDGHVEVFSNAFTLPAQPSETNRFIFP